MEIASEITDDLLSYWLDMPAAKPVVMKAPPGDPDCIDCAAVVTTAPDGKTVVRVPWKPDEIDLAHLAHGGTIWVSTWGGLPPHMLEVQAP